MAHHNDPFYLVWQYVVLFSGIPPKTIY